MLHNGWQVASIGAFGEGNDIALSVHLGIHVVCSLDLAGHVDRWGARHVELVPDSSSTILWDEMLIPDEGLSKSVELRGTKGTSRHGGPAIEDGACLQLKAVASSGFPARRAVVEVGNSGFENRSRGVVLGAIVVRCSDSFVRFAWLIRPGGPVEQPIGVGEALVLGLEVVGRHS